VRDASITHFTAKHRDVFTIGLIVVGLAFILTDRLWLDTRLKKQPVVSVETVNVPLQTPGPSYQYPPNQEYFSDGISEELLNLLARVPELQVIARTSSFACKGTDVKIADIAQELNVAHVLEGSVRKSGNQVRITAQLIRSTDSSHLWSATYDRTLDNIFAIQDDFAPMSIVDRLIAEPTG